MTTFTYITLTTSDYGLSKRFRVVMGSLQSISHRQQSRKRTLTGKSDSQAGHTYQGWVMTLRVHTQGDVGWGLMSDLEVLYALNDPFGTPSSKLVFVDNLGVAHNVELIGDLQNENLTPYLDGPDAAYLVSLAMEET